MGMPSIGIYSWELFTQYGVENIIRIGSAGSDSPQAKVFDVVLATSAYSESSYAKTQNGYDKDVTYPSEALCGALRKSAARLGMPLIEGAVHSSDVFYRDAEPVSYTHLDVYKRQLVGDHRQPALLQLRQARCGAAVKESKFIYIKRVLCACNRVCERNRTGGSAHFVDGEFAADGHPPVSYTHLISASAHEVRAAAQAAGLRLLYHI